MDSVSVRAPTRVIVSLPRFRGHPNSHENAIGGCHGKAETEEAAIVLAGVQGGDGPVGAGEREEPRDDRPGARSHRDLARGTTGWRHRRCRLTGPWGMANTNAPTNPRGAFFAPRAPPRRAAASRSPPGHPSCQCTR